MLTIHDAMNADELALVIDHLAKEFSRIRERGPLSVQDAQEVAGSVTRVQLILNELQRVELRERGVTREMAERFVALETSIRTIQDALYQELRCRKSLPSGRSNDAHDPAGR